ncbi:hypothetical protein HPP92_005015 [Vanilla planifolia]|uniref:Uncharacterized protein n=1 Tax=Vanilla planifolia TaxID=51239 RepID=A0A835VAK8_VANPL|nr:hypothetical protein HPP92_005015 [Vanilla planifolia]
MFQQIDIISSWYEGSQFDVLMKSCASIAFDMEIIFNTKIASCVLIVHLMAILLDGSVECLSMSLVEKISSFYSKMIENPNFSALVQQYSLRGYSEGKEVTRLVLNDLYYHFRGELEGRMIAPGPCHELSIFLLELDFFQCYKCAHQRDFLMTDVPLYDISSIRGELGIDLWDFSDLKKSKEIGEIMLSYMHTANLMMSFTNAKTYALKALVDVASLHIAKVLESKSTLSNSVVSDSFIENGITHVCKCLQSTEKSLITVLNPPEKLVELFATQSEMLVILSRILFVRYSSGSTKNLLPVLTILMRTLGSCLKLLGGLSISPMLNKSLKFLLMVLLMSLEYSYPKASINDSDLDVLQLTEVSVLAAGLLPVLCKCVENIECFDLSVASMDLLLKMVLPPDIWVHVLHESIHLEHLIQIMHQQNSRVSVAVAFNFFLTMAQTKGGAEMLCSNNLLSYLKIFLSNLVDEEPNPDEACFSSNGYKDDKHAHLLGLGFAIITAAIQSLHDDSSVFDIFDGTIRDFVAEAYTVFYFVSAPNLPSEGQSIKKKRIQGSPTSLTALRLVEHYLSLICLLEGQQSHQKRGLQEIDLDLRQKSIRLLSFISKEAQHAGEPSYNRTIPFICLPSLKRRLNLTKPLFYL